MTGVLEKVSGISVHVWSISTMAGVLFSCDERLLWLGCGRWVLGAALEARLRTVLVALVGGLAQGGAVGSWEGPGQGRWVSASGGH